jgi:hypothetical protein
MFVLAPSYIQFSSFNEEASKKPLHLEGNENAHFIHSPKELFKIIKDFL